MAKTLTKAQRAQRSIGLCALLYYLSSTTLFVYNLNATTINLIISQGVPCATKWRTVSGSSFFSFAQLIWNCDIAGYLNRFARNSFSNRSAGDLSLPNTGYYMILRLHDTSPARYPDTGHWQLKKG